MIGMAIFYIVFLSIIVNSIIIHNFRKSIRKQAYNDADLVYGNRMLSILRVLQLRDSVTITGYTLDGLAVQFKDRNLLNLARSLQWAYDCGAIVNDNVQMCLGDDHDKGDARYALSGPRANLYDAINQRYLD